MNWNVGSPIVMKYLQKSNILSMSDMIVHTYNQNQECAQLIFNDLLETEHMLLGDLIKNANSNEPTGMSLCEILNEGFKRLCNDFIQNPSILVTNYLTEVDEYIPGKIFFFPLESEKFRCISRNSRKKSIQNQMKLFNFR